MHLLAELRKMDDWDDAPSEPKIIVSIECIVQFMKFSIYSNVL